MSPSPITKAQGLILGTLLIVTLVTAGSTFLFVSTLPRIAKVICVVIMLIDAFLLAFLPSMMQKNPSQNKPPSLR